MKRIFTVLICLFVLFNLNGLPGKLLEGLSLSDDQKKQIDVILNDNQLKVEELLIDLQIKQYELKKLLINDNVNRTDLRNALKKIADVEAEIRFLKYTLELDILKLLDNEQKMKYKIYKINTDADNKDKKE